MFCLLSIPPLEEGQQTTLRRDHLALTESGKRKRVFHVKHLLVVDSVVSEAGLARRHHRRDLSDIEGIERVTSIRNRQCH